MTAAFSHPVCVYRGDTDAGGIVFYADDLRFFERARSVKLERAAWRGNAKLAAAKPTLACVGAGTFAPRRIPTPVLDALNQKNTP